VSKGKKSKKVHVVVLVNQFLPGISIIHSAYWDEKRALEAANKVTMRKVITLEVQK
jgi:hypothetical protein